MSAADGGKRILILGAGNCQIEAIDYCHDQGMWVAGCSYTNTDPGIPLLDDFRQVDIKDVTGVAAYAQEVGADAIYSVGSDLAMPTVMEASERLGLPHFITSEAARTCQNKGKMRTALAGSEWSLPFSVARTAEEAAAFDAFPAMMKPVDSQGQRGCYRVDSKADIACHFERSLSFSTSGAVILEKFVDGPEISVNAFIVDGEPVFELPSDRYSFEDLPGGIIKEHGLPCEVLDEQGCENVRAMVGDVITRLGVLNGPVYFQVKMDGQHPYVIEVTPRLDGCHMWRIIREYCAFDLMQASFDLLLTGTVPAQAVGKKPGEWRLTFFCAPPKTSFDRDAYDTSDALYYSYYYETGQSVRSLNGYMEKCGYKIRRVS